MGCVLLVPSNERVNRAEQLALQEKYDTMLLLFGLEHEGVFCISRYQPPGKFYHASSKHSFHFFRSTLLPGQITVEYLNAFHTNHSICFFNFYPGSPSHIGK